jgi:threonylcarbamoyladenosine tRNA methylthiotransferase MtaB
VNRVEADALTADLLAAGAQLAAADAAAVIIVNTCTVTAEADTKARKAIRQAARQPKSPWVIATGCGVNLDPAVWEALGERVIAAPNKDELVRQALALLGRQTLSDTEVPPIHSAEFRARRGVKVQDGCDNHCSYCIVPAARGAARSVPLQQIRENAQALEAEGVREIVLTGINLGRFRDADKGLRSLLTELLQATRSARFRLSSLEPPDCYPELLELIATSDGRLCAHLHLPLQSGSAGVLKAMERHYDPATYKALVQEVRATVPGIALTTDVMVGFPGETDAQHEMSLAFCREVAFSRMHVFRYSLRPGTAAARRGDQIGPTVKAQRAREMRALAQELTRLDLAARVGTRERVLVERSGRGMSESYHQVRVDAQLPPGSLIMMQFERLRDTLLEGIETP